MEETKTDQFVSKNKEQEQCQPGVPNIEQPFKLGEYCSKNRNCSDKSNLMQPHSIFKAYKNIKQYVRRTPISYAPRLSQRMGAKIYFKREDGQYTGSYKVRGLFHRLLNLTPEQKEQGVICATSGNQGASLGYVCSRLNMKAVIVMPFTVTSEKIAHIKKYAPEETLIIQHGCKLSESAKYAQQYAEEHNLNFITFQDEDVISGCATVGIDILEDIPEKQIDFILYSMSSGSLAAGLGSYFKHLSPETIQIGVQPEKEDSGESLTNQVVQSQVSKQMYDNNIVLSEQRNKHADILINTLDAIYSVTDGMACSFVTYLFNKENIVIEPHSAVCPAALEYLKEQIQGKTVVCILCGSFKYDIGRLAEIRTLSNVYEGKQYYLLVNFYAKKGSIKQFILNCLGDNDQVAQIEYTRKNNRDKGPALVSIESPSQQDFDMILQKLKQRKIDYKILTPKDELFQLRA